MKLICTKNEKRQAIHKGLALIFKPNKQKFFYSSFLKLNP